MVHVKFFFAIVWSVQLNLTLRDPAPDDLRNKMEGKNKPGGIEIYKHGGNGAEIQWNSCDNGLRKPPFEILEQIMFESLVDNFVFPICWADGAFHIHLYYLAPFFTQPTDNQKFTLLRI